MKAIIKYQTLNKSIYAKKYMKSVQYKQKGYFKYSENQNNCNKF